MKANAMCEYWTNNPDRWEEITIQEAQTLANDGCFVVSGWINESGGSGHVAVVVPGAMQYSGTWKMFVPVIIEAGENRRYSTVALSYGYNSDMKETIRFYVYK